MGQFSSWGAVADFNSPYSVFLRISLSNLLIIVFISGLFGNLGCVDLLLTVRIFGQSTAADLPGT